MWESVCVCDRERERENETAREERERERESERERKRICMYRGEEATARGRVVCGADKYAAKSAKLFIVEQRMEQRGCLLSGLGFGFIEKYK